MPLTISSQLPEWAATVVRRRVAALEARASVAVLCATTPPFALNLYPVYVPASKWTEWLGAYVVDMVAAPTAGAPAMVLATRAIDSSATMRCGLELIMSRRELPRQ